MSVRRIIDTTCEKAQLRFMLRDSRLPQLSGKDELFFW